MSNILDKLCSFWSNAIKSGCNCSSRKEKSSSKSQRLSEHKSQKILDLISKEYNNEEIVTDTYQNLIETPSNNSIYENIDEELLNFEKNVKNPNENSDEILITGKMEIESEKDFEKEFEKESNISVSSKVIKKGDFEKYINKKKGKEWSAEEDEILKKAVLENKGRNWKQIAKMIPGRTYSQCSQRWRRIQPYKIREPWTVEEDRKIINLVQIHGNNWAIISEKIPGRTGKQCRERYRYKLDPNIKKTKFTNEEDEQIIAYYAIYGSKWKSISEHLPGRTENMIKNRFYSHIKKKLLLQNPDKYKHFFEENNLSEISSKYKNKIEEEDEEASEELYSIILIILKFSKG